MEETNIKSLPNVTTYVEVQPGGYNIQHVENFYHADWLKAMGIENGEKKTNPDDTCSPKPHRGPQKQALFINGKSTKEDVQTKNKEKQRFLHYLSEHKLSSRHLNCNKEDLLNDIITCFLKIWQDYKLITDSPSGAAIFRFLTVDCQIKSDVTEQSYSNKIKERLRKNIYKPATMRDVNSAFN